MSQKTFLEEVISGEIQGKNAAIHSYDEMIWKVRSGFLTLFFGVWGLLLGAMLKDTPQLLKDVPHSIVRALLLISAGLASGGMATDLNYVNRKFKVIYDLNRLLELIVKHPDFESRAEAHQRLLLSVMRVSGDTKGGKPSEGWSVAAILAIVIYAVPFILTAAGLWLSGLVQ